MLVSVGQGLVLVDKAVNKGMDFSKLRLVISGGGMGARTMQLLKVLCDTLKCDFMGIWGQTECTGPVTVVKGDVAFKNPDTCGKPMSGIDLEIWDDDNNKLPAGVPGESWCAQMTAKLLEQPGTRTRLSTRGEWLRTGDLREAGRRRLPLLRGPKKGFDQDGGRERLSSGG